MLMECAGLFRPLGAPSMPRPGREGLAKKGPGFLGFSLKEENPLGAAELSFMLSLVLSERDLCCQDSLDSSILPMLMIVGGAHGL